MKWNWQHNTWPEFEFKKSKLVEAELKFLSKANLIYGASKHLSKSDSTILLIELASSELQGSFEIEGEYLNRASLQSSVRKHFGFETDNRVISDAEAGSSEMITDYYNNFNKPLSHEMLFNWHKMITNGRRDIGVIGGYRKHREPMQIISGKYHDPIIHFEAPPSENLKVEMDRFINWFNNRNVHSNVTIDTLCRAGITHLYFESIHPFEDGNGRIGRLLVLKSLSQSMEYPIILALSHIINKGKKLYYEAFEKNTMGMEITLWLEYFADVILKAQEYTLNSIEFLIKKTKFYDKFRGQFNFRQEKVIKRIFDEGIEGFEGGLSAVNYARISGAPSATTTRDLQGLVEMKALFKTGQLKGSRYYLNFEE